MTPVGISHQALRSLTCFTRLSHGYSARSLTLTTRPVPSRARLFSMEASGPRRFAPLGSGKGEVKGVVPVLKGVVFDVDGTLCKPQSQMFKDMRAGLSIPPQTDILDHVASLPPAAQSAAHATLRQIETRYMRLQTPQPGLAELMDYLEERGVRKGICTRNFDGPVQHLLDKFLQGNGVPEGEASLDGGVEGVGAWDGAKFWPIVTRDFRPPKPHPAGILHIAKAWGLTGPDGEGDGSGLVMVGDSMDDMLAGRGAGAATVLLLHADNAHVVGSGAVDLVVRRLDELVGVLEGGFEGGAGGEGDAGVE